MTIVSGGKNIYGFSLGILMLESQFPRIPGEMGNACTWDFPVLYKVVQGASPKRVVADNDPALLDPFIEAARALEKEGVRAITTNCGFLAMFQQEMNKAVTVPLFTSALMMLPLVYSMLQPSQKVGVLTVNSATLSEKIFEGAGAAHIPRAVMGLENEPEFTSTLIENKLTMDVAACREEHRKVARQLVEKHPEVGAIVLECTNMPPYSHDVQEVTGLPVFDIVTFVNFVQQALVKKHPAGIL